MDDLRSEVKGEESAFVEESPKEILILVFLQKNSNFETSAYSKAIEPSE